MKTTYAAIFAITLSALAAGHASAEYAMPDHAITAMASTSDKTRDQVRAELVEAQRAGDIVAFGYNDKKLNEVNPSQYPAKASQQGLTREQVLAELAQAKRSGEFTLQQNHGG